MSERRRRGRPPRKIDYLAGKNRGKTYDPHRDVRVTHPELAQRAIDWFPRYLRHTTGQWHRKPFHLLEWQKAIIGPLFGALRPDGTRQYRKLYLEVGKKNGKSELGAGIALHLLYADHEPNPLVFSAASDREQAGIVFDVAADMVDLNPKLAQRAKVVRSTRRMRHNKGGSYRVVSADVKTKHGPNLSGLVFDELHTQPNRDLFDTLTFGSGSARAQPLHVYLTTAGYDRQSICWEQHEHAQSVINGTIEDPELLAVIYAANEKDDWTVEAVWRKANPSLGVSPKIEDLRTECEQAKYRPALQNLFRRFRLSQWTSQESRYLDLGEWLASSGGVYETDLVGELCFAGLDLSSRLDLTAWILAFPDGDYIDVLPRFFLPADGIEERSRRDGVPYQRWAEAGLIQLCPGATIQYDWVVAQIVADDRKFKIRECAFDRWGAEYLTQRVEAKTGITMVEFAQGYSSFSEPTKLLAEKVAERFLTHGDHPVLTWQAEAMNVQQDVNGNLRPVKPDRRKSVRRIDGMVALIMALDRCSRYTPSVYDTRGVISLGSRAE